VVATVSTEKIDRAAEAQEPQPAAAPGLVSMRALREELGITQNGLAHRARVSISVVQKLEGPGRVEADTVRRIAKALGVPAESVQELAPMVAEPGRRGVRPGENLRTPDPSPTRAPRRTKTRSAPAASVAAPAGA
jgi:transcriptional regulator with XRE-family HTH domain